MELLLIFIGIQITSSICFPCDNWIFSIYGEININPMCPDFP